MRIAGNMIEIKSFWIRFLKPMKSK